MGAHLIDGQFQSDKYPTCPPGKVPLSVRDPTAQDLLWQYAQRRRPVDAEFSSDLETALLGAGYVPPPADLHRHEVRRAEALQADRALVLAKMPDARCRRWFTHGELDAHRRDATEPLLDAHGRPMHWTESVLRQNAANWTRSRPER